MLKFVILPPTFSELAMALAQKPTKNVLFRHRKLFILSNISGISLVLLISTSNMTKCLDSDQALQEFNPQPTFYIFNDYSQEVRLSQQKYLCVIISEDAY